MMMMMLMMMMMMMMTMIIEMRVVKRVWKCKFETVLMMLKMNKYGGD